jgi:hypothetical protein
MKWEDKIFENNTYSYFLNLRCFYFPHVYDFNMLVYLPGFWNLSHFGKIYHLYLCCDFVLRPDAETIT